MESPTEGLWDRCIGWKGNHGFIRVSQVEAELAKRVLALNMVALWSLEAIFGETCCSR